jgi:hypothetical protein
MSQVSGTERQKKHREKLIAAGLVEKTVWVPAAFATALMAFALDLRRRAGLLLPNDPPLDSKPVNLGKLTGKSGGRKPGARIESGTPSGAADGGRRTGTGSGIHPT